MSDAPLCSIVVPTYNECENVPELLKQIEEALAGVDFEILVVDDSSPDGTHAEVEKCAEGKPFIKGLLNPGERGLSPSITYGFDQAQGEYLVCMDGDLQHNPADLPKLLKSAEEHDMVIGSRHVEGGGFEQKWGWHRHLCSRFGALSSQIILGIKCQDPMSGFFLVRREAYQAIRGKLNPKGFKIMLEMLFFLTVAKEPYRITETGIMFRNRIHGESKLSAKVIFEYLKMLLTLRGKH